MITLAWVQGLRGPEPQLWKVTPTNGAGHSPTPLQSHELPDHYGELPLAHLITLFPYKEPAHETV